MKSEKCAEAPSITVIIPHLNQPDHLAACLKSLRTQTLDASQFEVIVVDNGSNGLPEQVVGNDSRVRLLVEQEAGPGPARNRGVRAATSDILAFIDADCRAHPEWLCTALTAVNAVGRSRPLGGDVQIWRDDQTAYTSIEAYESIFSYDQRAHIEHRQFSGTGNLVVPRAVFDAVGPFKGIHLAEDVEWGQRATAAGFTFSYVANMIVYHPARRSLKELYVQWDRQTHHAFNDAKNKRWWKIRWLARALAVGVSPIVHVAKVISSRRVKGAAARLGALKILLAVRLHRAKTMVDALRSSRGVVWNRDYEVTRPDRD